MGTPYFLSNSSLSSTILPALNTHKMAALAKEAVDNRVHVIVVFPVVAEKYDQFIAAMKECAIATNKEKGCIKYNLHMPASGFQDGAKTKEVVLIEEWTSQKELGAHLKSEHITKWKAINKEQNMCASIPVPRVLSGPLFSL